VATITLLTLMNQKLLGPPPATKGKWIAQ
jgi:hypothetical protein